MTTLSALADSRPAEWSLDWVPPPTYGTRRRLERDTLGPQVTSVAAGLGIGHFAAQRYLVDVAMEIDPDTGLLAYSTVIALLHRQFGKTMAVVFPVAVMRGAKFDLQVMTYTAQDKNYAKRKLEQDLVAKILRRSKRLRDGRDYHYKAANGAELLTFLRRGSTLTPAATKESSGHGLTLDMSAVDEAWIHRDADVDDGFSTPMITRYAVHPGAQQWVVSAAGNQHSHYLRSKVELGRRAVEADSGRGVAYFEWSCPPEWDIYDRKLWWFYIPALGHTIREADVAAELDKAIDPMSLAKWKRAFASQFQEEEDTTDGMDLEAWSRQVDARSTIESGLLLAVDGSPDRQWASIGAAGWRSDGGLHVELVDTRAGMSWLGPETIAVARRQGVKKVAVDPTSSAGSIIAELEAAGLEVVKMPARAHAHAAGSLYDRTVDGRLWHTGQSDLEAAVIAARRRPLGDAWAWDRKNDEDNLTPFVAVTLAAGAVLAAAEAPEEPSVYDELEGFGEW